MFDRNPDDPMLDENDVEDLDDIMDFYGLENKDLIKLDGLFDDPENIEDF